MIELDITNESENLLKLLYTVYRKRREDGKGRVESKNFGSAEDIHDEYLSKMQQCDVLELCFELLDCGCLTAFQEDNSLCCITLTDTALVYGEQRFKRNIKELWDWFSALAGPLPF